MGSLRTSGACALPVMLALVACGKDKPAPPVGAGIFPPVVASELPADFTFRWPAGAAPTVTMRLVYRDSAEPMVMQSTLELGERDEQGARTLKTSAFEAVGGTGAGIVAAVIGFSFDASDAPVKPDGRLDSEAPNLWFLWVEPWFDFTEVKEGEPVQVSSAELEMPGVEALMQRRASTYDGATRLSFVMQSDNEEGRKTLQSLVALGRSFGEVKEVAMSTDIDPRTMQPITSELVLAFIDKPDRFRMSFEFDWSRRRNEDTR